MAEGYFILEDRLLVYGSDVVSATGHWAGVPQQFFDRIPDKHGPDWAKRNPPIPGAAPRFMESQESRLRERLAKSR